MRMCPAIMSVKVYKQRYRLQQHAGIQSVLQEQKKQQNVIQISKPEVCNLSFNCKENAKQAGNNGNYFQSANALAHNCEYRSEERRVGKECRSRWSPYH